MILNFDYESLNRTNGLVIGVHKEQDEELVRLSNR